MAVIKRNHKGKNNSNNNLSAQNSEKSIENKLELDDDKKYKTLATKSNNNFKYIGERWLTSPLPAPEWHYTLWRSIVTLVAFIVRFYKIWYPKEVVFDEVHFGKFASYYLERTYFFDVHPPFAKMLIAFIGYLRGYDGSFKFDEIGYSYETNPAPYLAYRCFNALLGTLTVPIMFNTLKEMNFKAVTCAFAGFLVALDNAHIVETRLILLDATLIISVAASIYCYVRFYKAQLKAPFSYSWFFWLYLTGLSLSFVISTKYVGVFTFVMVGIAVLVNLWQLLDIRASLNMKTYIKHFTRRVSGLILAPFMVYLFWFWVHFSVLTKSGPGDSFMSFDFQETLSDSPMARETKQVNYYDIVTFEHKDTNTFLHSHLANYPLRYEDGRISSQGQIVTTSDDAADVFNQWEILPTKELESTTGQPVRLNEHIRLRHVATNTYLLAHDVASPFYPTNEEIVTVSEEDANDSKYAQTLFMLQALKKNDGNRIVNTRGTVFRLFHVDTAVALWSHNDVYLPEWAGENQQEVNGNKKVTEPSNNWLINSITNLNDDRLVYIPKQVKKLPFLTKWWEAQRLMFEHNNKLSSEHPFASQPYSWPGSLSGVSFWTKDSERVQIYFIGNIFGWWAEIISLAVYLGLIIVDLISRQRGVYILNALTRDKIYGPLMYLFAGWCFHYFPFYLMARQKFLHHYLPAHLIAALFTGALWETIFTDCRNANPEVDEGEDSDTVFAQPKLYLKYYGFFLILMLVGLTACFIFFAPLSYGDISLDSAALIRRQWFNIKLNYIKQS
ncbi:hypothetical protein TBLA_0A10670 [Henningerozyma blattae CBS 6284]|uniref:Dolichyl-phosphate-mannose--protein mannosyltransferase n=1 Tax=Henningerozyma blattae (strain ATCC 34711 / CBS 6284 / DSM 70876 / NBRC 10599 / NRRL Y-10934 / UCD 77-7) TaxID=1071380 RepID=I2GXJ3_HENB6|nr:hypothetical protein TBLA_0A10670 [Tetrapisispora blattae CBS 6284]CCH58845.1 hypothetical protein TBLA_0A10670 [Tetrapisispora blattae CBS 6284]